MRQTTPSHRAAFPFILVTVTLDMLSLGLVTPVLPQLILRLEAGRIGTASLTVGAFGFVWAAMQFLFSPLLGVLSDRYGRRPVILLSNMGLGLDSLFMALAPTVRWLFIGRIISGITSSSFVTAGAYVTDITPPQERAARFGILGAAFGLGFILGPAVGGLLGAVHLRLPFWVAGALGVVNAIYGACILPESLPVERRTAFRWRKANPIGSLKLLRSRSTLFSIAAGIFLLELANESLQSIFVLYTHYRYAWAEKMTGLSLATLGVIGAIFSALLVERVVKRWREHCGLIVALMFEILGFVAFALASSTNLFWLGIPFVAAWGLSGPILQALATQQVSPQEQGQLQGALNSLISITGMVGPVIFTQALYWTTRPESPARYSGLPFLTAAGILILCVGVVHRIELDDVF